MTTINGNNWATPDYIFQPLNDIFNFDCDVAATEWNAKCDFFINQEQNAHVSQWGKMNWCNPPYGRGLTEPFVDDAIVKSVFSRTIMLHKCDPSTVAFKKTWGFYHYFYYKRVKFIGAKAGATFPVCLTLFGEYTISELQKLSELKRGHLIR